MHTNLEKFKVLVRATVHVALEHRVIPYGELQQRIGISRQEIGKPLAALGYFSISKLGGCPLLNALAVNTNTFRPTPEGFEPYLQRSIHDTWGSAVSRCWSWAHTKGEEYLTGLDSRVADAWDRLQAHVTLLGEDEGDPWDA